MNILYRLCLCLTLFLSSEVFGSDSLVVRLQARADLNSSFFKCSVNPWRKLFDSSHFEGLTAIKSIIIQSNKDTLQFTSGKTSLKYLIAERGEGFIRFKSFEQDFARTTSICNTNLYPYYLSVNKASGLAILLYDKSKFMRFDTLVFSGFINREE